MPERKDKVLTNIYNYSMPVKTIDIKTKITASQKLENLLIAEFEHSKHSLFGNVLLREQAMNSFVKLGIPNRKNEEYKYINVDLILKDNFSLTSAKTFTPEQLKPLSFLTNTFTVVIENGMYRKDLSSSGNLPKGLTISSLAEAWKKNTDKVEAHYSKAIDIKADAFAALNTALAQDGAFIYIEKNTVIETPVHIIHVSSATNNSIINPRNLIVVETNAQATIIESYHTVNASAKTFNNAVTEINVAPNAILNHYKLQDENEYGYLVNTTQILQKERSVVTTNTYTLSGSLVRNNLNIALDGQHIETHLNGLYLTKGNQSVDNHTTVDHQQPNCDSNELYKGIIEDKSTATFNGKIFVRKNAQKTNAFQSNKNILLSDDGTINTKPQLEIYADDVKCSHGTSTGKLDDEKIFYLRSRGLSEASAKKLLMYAFASEVTNTIKIDELKTYLENRIAEHLK